MKRLEFKLEFAGEADKETIAEVTELIDAALSESITINSSAAVPVGGSRGVAEIATVIAVALSVAVDIEKGLEALEGIFAKFQKLFSEPQKKSEQILAGLKPSDILISVDGILVPMNRLTEENLAWLRNQ